eukprot:5437433-Amphidinium_carterae.3
MDVQAEDPAIRARYNAAKLEQHQSRHLRTNTYDAENEPMGFVLFFGRMLGPAGRADILATFKRAWTVVLGKQK